MSWLEERRKKERERPKDGRRRLREWNEQEAGEGLVGVARGSILCEQVREKVVEGCDGGRAGVHPECTV